jgi:cytoskeletal protein RodZ
MTEEMEEEMAPRRQGVGPQLRAAREKEGLTLKQVAAETRIPLRHLEHIEDGDFDALPGRTYAVGFAKNFAKAVGLDQSDVAAMVTHEMGDTRPRRRQSPSFEPGDPARVPSARLGWFSVFAVILLLVGLFFAARLLFSPAAELPSLTQQQAEEQAAQQAAAQRAAAVEEEAAIPSGPVVFTAEGPAWVRFYDAQGRVLMEGEMAEGESYTVPEEAERPQILTARPDRLTITIGGEEVPKLAEELVTLRDVPVTAEALLARGEEGAGQSAQ